jgi:lysophospholipase L1-like esterase
LPLVTFDPTPFYYGSGKITGAKWNAMLDALATSIGAGGSGPIDPEPDPGPLTLTPTAFTDSLVTTTRSGYIETSALARTVFTTTATTLTIHGYTNLYSAFTDKTWASLAVYSNGAYIGSAQPTADGTFTSTITLPSGAKTVEIVNGVQSKPSSLIGTFLVSVDADAGMTQTFPSAAKTCFLVDSIGVGTNAAYPNKSGYIGLLRRATTDNLLCYGWGYGKLADVAADTSALAAQLAAAGVTRLVVALGTNDYGLNGQTAASFQTQLAALADAFRAAVPTGTVVGLTPLTRATETANSLGSTLADYRSAYATVDGSRSWMTLISGPSLLTTMDMADGLHPTTYGHFRIAQQLGPLLGYTMPTPLPFFTSDNAKVTDQGSGVYRIEKTSGGASFNAGAFAIASQSGDFSYSFVPQALQDTVVSITAGSPSASDSYLDNLYGLYIEGTSGVLRGQDGNVNTPNLGTYVGGDRLWIDRTGTTLTFRRGATFAGGATLRTVTGVSGTVTLDISLFTVGGKLDVSIGGGGLGGGGGGADPAFTLTSGPDANGSVTDLGSGIFRATKTGGGSGFNCGFYSPNYTGDFTFKAVTNQVGDIMLGLSTAASSGSSYTDMSGQIYLDGSGGIQSYTGSSTTGNIGTYVSGDTFWIIRSGGTVTIKKGASLGSASTVRTFTLAGTVALDVSMATVGNTIDLSRAA